MSNKMNCILHRNPIWQNLPKVKKYFEPLKKMWKQKRNYVILFNSSEKRFKNHNHFIFISLHLQTCGERKKMKNLSWWWIWSIYVAFIIFKYIAKFINFWYIFFMPWLIQSFNLLSITIILNITSKR